MVIGAIFDSAHHFWDLDEQGRLALCTLPCERLLQYGRIILLWDGRAAFSGTPAWACEDTSRRARRVRRASMRQECTPAAARRDSRRRVATEPEILRVGEFLRLCSRTIVRCTHQPVFLTASDTCARIACGARGGRSTRGS